MQDSQTMEDLRKVAELIRDVRIAMLVTRGADGRPRSRPMLTQEAEFDGHVWFLTREESSKVREIRSSAVVNLGYAAVERETYVSFTGRAEILNDRPGIRSLWQASLRNWFDGPEDPGIRLIRVGVEFVDYWDAAGARTASLITIPKAVLSRGRAEAFRTLQG
jgi:general stress protein 26